MVEEIIQSIKQAMMPDLTDAQMEKLENVLYIQFHGKRITAECSELAPTGEDGDVAKINMFLGSKKTTGRDVYKRQDTDDVMGHVVEKLKDAIATMPEGVPG